MIVRAFGHTSNTNNSDSSESSKSTNKAKTKLFFTSLHVNDFINLRPPISLQAFLRKQDNKTNYNLVSETLSFLDCICGSTTGGLGLLGLYINEHNVSLINQCLCSLTEYCQGPCHENQVCYFTLYLLPESLLNDIASVNKTQNITLKNLGRCRPSPQELVVASAHKIRQFLLLVKLQSTIELYTTCLW